MDSKKCRPCFLGKVDPKDMPACLMQKISFGSKALMNGDYSGLEDWGKDDGLAYLSIYLCIVMACMSTMCR